VPKTVKAVNKAEAISSMGSPAIEHMPNRLPTTNSLRSCTKSITAQDTHSLSRRKQYRFWSDSPTPTMLEELMMIPQIHWSTVKCNTLFPFSFLSTSSAFWSWANLRPRIRGQCHGAWCIWKSPVGPGQWRSPGRGL